MEFGEDKRANLSYDNTKILHEYQLTLFDGSQHIVKAYNSVEAVTKLKRKLNKDFITVNVKLYREIARRQK